MNIIEILNKTASYPTKPFAVLESTTITYGDLKNCIERLSVVFDQMSLNPQDKILLSTTDNRSFIEILLGAYRFGLTVLLIDPNTKSPRIQAILKDAPPKAYFIDADLKTAWSIEGANVVTIQRKITAKPKFFQKVFGKKQTLDTLQVKTTYPDCINQNNNIKAVYPSQIKEDSIAYIIYTSGSTTEPKGVMISHKNLFSHLKTLAKVYQCNPTTHILNVLNLYHTDGVNHGPLLAFYCGGTWFAPFKLDTTQLDLLYYGIYKYQITHLVAVPTLLALFEKYHEGFEDSFQTPHFKFILSAAAYLESRLWHSISNLFQVQVVNVYGLTESVTGSIFCGPEVSTFKIGTIGKPVDCHFKIVHESGDTVAPMEKGELLLQGDHIMVGYFNNLSATRAVLKDGWLYTGDIAQTDEEGFIKIVGRKKNMINAGGFSVQPEEIEEVISQMEEVEACKVIGLPDNILGEQIVACIQVKANERLEELSLYAFLRKSLEPEKVPHKVHFLETFPRGLSGKVQVEELKLQILDKTIGTEPQKNILATIIATAAAIFKVNPNEIHELSDSTTVSGWDSLHHLVFITQLEALFEVQFVTAEIMVMNKINTIHSIIRKKLS